MVSADALTAYREQVATSVATLSRTPRSDLRWVTVVIAAHIITLDDDITHTIRDEVEHYHRERRQVYRRSGRISRHERGQTRWAGCVELDLIHPRLACSRLKSELLADLGVEMCTLQAHQRIVVVHEHAVVDVRGHATPDALLADLRAAWPGCRRVHASGLRGEGTVRENLDRLASYSTKFSVRYSVSWCGRQTKYTAPFEAEWSKYVDNIYRGIGYEKLHNTNVISQAKPRLAEFQNVGSGECFKRKTQRFSTVAVVYGNGYSGINQNDIGKGTEGYEGIMRVHEIIGKHIDLKKIGGRMLKDIISDLERMVSPAMDDHAMQMLYGDERGDLEAEKLRAEVEKLRAAAGRDRAAAGHIEDPRPPR